MAVINLANNAVVSALTNPPLTFNFLITLIDSSSVLTSVLTGIQNTVLGGFSECTGLETTMDIEPYSEGGNNGTVLQFPTRVKWTNLHLKRGVVLSDDLWNWHYAYVEGKGKRRDGIIVLQNDLHIPLKVWHFRRGLPMRWAGPTMNAAQSQLAVEELEIVHEGLKLYAPGAALSSATGVSF